VWLSEIAEYAILFEFPFLVKEGTLLSGEMLSFQVLFQVNEQKEVARCDVRGVRWLRHQDEAQLFDLFNGHFGGVWFGVVHMPG
jgi:hypothetical protein